MQAVIRLAERVMQERGWDSVELHKRVKANGVSLSYSSLRRLLKGEVKEPGLPLALALSELVNLPIEAALGLAAPAPTQRAVPVLTETTLADIGQRLEETDSVVRWIMRNLGSLPTAPATSSPQPTVETAPSPELRSIGDDARDARRSIIEAARESIDQLADATTAESQPKRKRG